MERASIEQVEAASQEQMWPDESPREYIYRVALLYSIDSDLTLTVAGDGTNLDEFCNRLEHARRSAEDSTDAAPLNMAERVEQSDDFQAALQQSTGLVVDHRAKVIMFSLGMLLGAAMMYVYLG